MIERFKAARASAAPVADAAGAAALADMRARITAHAGDPDLMGAATLRLVRATPPTVTVDLPQHAHVRVTLEKDVLRFAVTRGRGSTTFDRLADALAHGAPLKFEGGRMIGDSFDTRKASRPTT